MIQLQLPIAFSPDALQIDPERESQRIAEAIRRQVAALRRKGVVVGISGGVDSSVCAALCVKALGPNRVLGLLMPERDSSGDSLRLGRVLAKRLRIEPVLEDVSEVLESAGCYRRRDEAIRRVIPDYGPGWKAKIVLPNLLAADAFRLFSVVVRTPEGELRRERLPLEAYQQCVAATNFKQRVRKMMEYYHADRLRYAVVGTPNRLEYDQGFFVKNGDGAADLKPIAHLYKTQVYAVARFLEVPEEIRTQAPSTDTYSLPQTQEEFYFALPYGQMDLLLYAYSHTVAAEKAGRALGLSTEQVDRAYRDIVAKRRAAALLHQRAIVLENVE